VGNPEQSIYPADIASNEPVRKKNFDMKSIVITGASRGIGKAIATRLAEEGTTLYLQGRNQSKLDETAAICRDKKSETHTIASDLSTREGIESVANSLRGISVFALINNAGVSLTKPFDQISFEEWNKVMATNLTAPFYLSRLLAGQMTEGSAIVNVSSGAAYTAFPGQSAYCASKFGLEGFSECVREELRSRKIRLISIYPAATYTDMWRSIPGNWPVEKMLTAEQVAESVAFVLDQPQHVGVEFLRISNIAGRL
jgi:short-subunit dehydrogenase